MGLFQLPKVCILLLVASLSTAESATSDETWVGPSLPSPRVLRAATRKADVFRRSVRIAPRYDTHVSYIEEENGWNGVPIFASQVKVGSEAPILHLEEVEHHLTDVHCGNGKMKLSFVDIVSAMDAKASCSGGKGGRIITSHAGCNKEGERAVYKVNDATVSVDDLSLELSVVESTWKDAFQKFDIDFGYTHDDHIYRRHADFEKVRRKRQAASTVSAEIIPVPSDTPKDVTSQTFNISSELINSKFALPDFVNTALSLIPLPTVNVPIDLTCKNCTTTGTLVLTQGAINIDLGNLVDFTPDGSVITGGFFELAANDMSAHIELVAKPIASDTFSVTLPGLPILGFVIPEIGSAGATFNQTLEASYDITKSVEVTYGFDLVVPSPSTIRVELTDFTKSGVVGFSDSQLTPLPFSANASDIEVLLGLAYLPSVPIAFKFLDQLDVGVKVSMDLPRLDLKISTADTNCDANTTANTNLPSVPLPGPFADLGPLVLVSANVSISLDVGAEFEFPLLPANLNSFNTAANIFATTFQLVTSCLAANNNWAPATTFAATKTGGGDEAGGTQTGGGYGAPTAVLTATDTGLGVCSTSVVTITLPYIPPAVTVPAPTSSAVGGYAPPANGTVQTTMAPSGTGGYMVPSPTAPQEFTGAASPALVPAMNWSGAGWQVMAAGASFVAGVMVLL